MNVLFNGLRYDDAEIPKDHIAWIAPVGTGGTDIAVLTGNGLVVVRVDDTIEDVQEEMAMTDIERWNKQRGRS